MSRNVSEEDPNFPEAFKLGSCCFSPKTRELRDATGKVLHLRSQSAEVLAHLLKNPGTVVPKADLFDAVWAGTSVTGDSLVQCISEIRRCLDDRDHRIIETAARRGYKVNAVPVPADAATSDRPETAQPSIAVLAFEDYSAGDDSRYLSDAIAEGIIAELSRFPELFVVARNSSFSFRGKATRVGEISRALGVRYLLEGSQQKAGNRLRVTAQLIDARERHHLWSEAYARDMDDLFAVQDDIVRRVVATVAQKVITLEGRRPRDKGGTKRTALLHHLEARQYLIRFTPEANEKARQANLAAIRADPAEPYGYVGLAFVHINGHRWGWTALDPAEALDEARRAARHALELAPDYYDSHAAMAYVHLEENQLDRAIARAERALELNPNDTNGMCDLADFLGYAGRAVEAEALLQKAMRLDPLHPDWIRWNMAWVQWLNRDCEAALRTMMAMSEMPPMAYRTLAIIHICLGRKAEAQDAVRKLREFAPGYSISDVRRNYSGKFRNVADLERVVENLRDAGLPE